MSKMVQIRHVPDDVHRKLKARAALAGMSLSDYLLDEVHRLAALPTLAEMMDRLSRREPVKLKPSPARVIRAQRDSR